MIISTLLMLLIIVPVMALVVLFAWRRLPEQGNDLCAGLGSSTSLPRNW